MPLANKKRKKIGQRPPLEKTRLEYLTENLSNNSPNPKRIGCPTHEALERNAKDPIHADDVISKHVAECSPCYRHYARLLREEIVRIRREASRRTPADRCRRKSKSPRK